MYKSIFTLSEIHHGIKQVSVLLTILSQDSATATTKYYLIPLFKHSIRQTSASSPKVRVVRVLQLKNRRAQLIPQC